MTTPSPEPTPDQFAHIRRAYLDLEPLGPAQREDRLRELRTGDPLVASSVAAMLAIGVDDRLEEPAFDLHEALSRLESSQEEPPPGRVGRYRIVDRLGRGMSGEVLLAVQEGPVEREVALKLFRWAPSSRSARARFEREARALLRLRHPGIAQLLDVGVADNGQPYLAFELLRGLPIDQAAAGLSLDERLELLAQVCDAVHHAHVAGVIHRDIKPGNVLVLPSQGGTAPRPKVIDFGVAKLLSEDLGTQLTLDGQAIGTPGFMSPEQLQGATVDASTDVYSLGVLVATTLAPHASPDARGSLATLPRTHRRDLQAIAARATAERPGDRYPSAAHLAEDLRRCLHREPVQARRWSPAYATLRFLRRRPWTATGAALALGAIITLGSLAAVSRQLLWADLRDQRAMLAGTVVDVVSQLGQLSGTGEARLKLIDSLLDRTDRVLRSMPEDPELREARARLLGEKGDILFEQGDFERCDGMRVGVEAELAALSAGRPENLELARAAVVATIKRGDLAAAREGRDAAYAFYAAAAQRLESLLASHPDSVGLLDDLCWSDDRLESFVSERESPEAVEALLLRRLGRAKHLLEIDPAREVSLLNLHTAHQRLLRFYTKSREFQRADELVEPTLDLGRRLILASPHRVAFVVADAEGLWIVGYLRHVETRFAEAENLAAAALNAAAALPAENPARTDILLRIAEIWCFRATNALATKDGIHAAEYARRCLDVVREARDRGAPEPSDGSHPPNWLVQARAIAGEH
ncbi:MAG: serine/threonine protein kinase [Phycisphaerales bacterium]|nr:serine/threonine protein kinase [Phycisphaerales bacterium]